MRKWIILWLILCFVGATLEWCYGTLWSLFGQTPWIYPHSMLTYTSFEGLPLWGLGGLIPIVIYRAYKSRKLQRLLPVLPLLALASLYVIVYGLVTA